MLGAFGSVVNGAWYDNDNDNDLFRLGGLFGLYVDLYCFRFVLNEKTRQCSTATNTILHLRAFHLLNGCSTVTSTTVRLLGLLSDVT